MKVHQIMSKKIVTVGMDDTLGAIKEIFDNVSFHHLLVVERGHLFGVISDRDLLRSISSYAGTLSESARDVRSLKRKAHQILSRQPVTLSPDADVFDAVDVFLNNNISCIPVVDDEKKPVGLISWRDILNVISESKQAKVN